LLFQRLGIKFDVYDGEANQVQAAQKVVEELKEKGLLQYKYKESCIILSY